jgi:hypothetical protein
MASKKEETKTLTGERTLSKDIPYYKGAYASSTGWASHNGWQTGPPGPAYQALMYETYWDLSGYELADLTLMPVTAVVQDPGAYTSDDTNTPIMIVLDIISQERLDIEDITRNIAIENVPSMPTTTNDWNNITYGRYRLMMNSADFNETGTQSWLVAKQDNFGSGSPCVVQKLYIYRYVLMKVNDGKIMTLPASRFILSALITHEKDLIYIERLRRNYQTQGSVD